MSKITAYIAQDHYKTTIIGNSNQIIADEPKTVGGTEQGLSPTELLASSLASCTCITVRMYADRKKWPLNEFIVTVSFERDEQKQTTRFEKTMDFIGDLDESQLSRLREIAEKCPVNQILSNQIEIVSI
ncbi:OsmC family protein [Pseudopedobacter beijingensis]|uniref:OsmC family protein n=1 Tax=Pseudopedobacter beijingensis TaxID=1207056 RepID=A0ABW4IIE1_9SPHI